MGKNRDKDKSFYLVPGDHKSPSVSLDVVKSAYIAEGLSPDEIADRYSLPVGDIEDLVEKHKLGELRKAYIREGVSKIQNIQLGQAQRMLDLELGFKKLRLKQLEDRLNDFAAYYARHGDLYKRHPVTGDILRDTDGIPLQLSVPNVAREINQLKESVTLSEGLKKLMSDLDSIINGQPKAEDIDEDGEVIDMEQVDKFFKKKV